MSGAQLNSGQIQFVEIPYTWKVPGEYMEVKPAINDNALFAFPAYGAIMGPMTVSGAGAGNAAPGQPYQILSGAQANALFGTGSPLAKMCWKWLKANPYTPVDAIGIAPQTGNTAATGSLTIAGTATAAGTIAFYFGGVRVPVQVSLGDTAAIVAANLYAAIVQQNSTAGYTPLPSLTASYTAASAVVNMTAGNIGTLGNMIDMRINAQVGDVTPAGLTVTIAPMSGGAGDPTTTVSAALAGLSKWYTDIAFAWTDATNTATLAAWLTGRYGAMVKQDCQAYVAKGGTYGTILTYQPNNQFISVLPMQNPLTPPWEMAASFGGACCYQTAQAPALQLRTVSLPGVVAPAGADVFSLAEREMLLVSGFSTFYTDSGGNVYIERATTSYRTDADGALNTNYFDLQSTKVPTRVRYDWNNYCAQLYPRNALAQDGTLAATYAPNVVTPRRLLASWTSRSAVYEKNGWIQNSAVTAKQSSFAIDPNDGNRVNARQQIDLMGNLMVLAGSLEFLSNN
jgi:phage tail sheath gpL-like